MTINKIILPGILATVAPRVTRAETGREFYAAVQAAAGPEAHRHRGVDAPGTRDRVIAGGSYAAVGALVDGYRAGNPDAQVTGVVVAARATTTVLHRAVELGANVIVSRTAFLGDSMDRPVAQPEPALADKIDFIEKNNLMVLRLFDPRTGLPGLSVVTALPEAIGLKSGRKDTNLADGLVYETDPVSVVSVIRKLKAALPTQTVRLVGDPNLMVTGIAIATETSRPNALNVIIGRDDVDLLIAGEVHETETTPYVMDSNTIGRMKALVLVGSIQMQEPAARKLAEWLKSITDKPVTYVPTGDPYIEVG